MKSSKSLKLIKSSAEYKTGSDTLSKKYDQAVTAEPQYQSTPGASYRKKIKNTVVITPKNIAQEELVDYLDDNSKRIIFSIGPAGVGKSYLMTLKAIQMLKEGDIDKIIITRPSVGADEDIGFLPGGIIEKMAPWTRPIMDIFAEYFTAGDIKHMIEESVLEICPIGFVRGRTFKNAVIIFDEAQNATQSQTKAVLTRIGEGSRMFVTGDITQTDLKAQKSGLLDIMERLMNWSSNSIAMTEFNQSHIERDPVVAEVLKIYGDE